MHLTLILLLLGFIQGCKDSPETTSGGEEIAQKQPTFSIVYSHNIHGELYPCGCQRNPLGGLAPAIGLLTNLRSKGAVVYVDAGDTFFPNNSLPKDIEASLSYSAETLAQGLDLLGLRFYVPGDQDLARGPRYLIELLKNRKYEVLLANKSPYAPFPSKKWAHYKAGKQQFFLIGLTNPEFFKPDDQAGLTSPMEAMSDALGSIKDEGYDKNNKDHHLIVVSHLGATLDDALAEKFPQIQWILGAHDQRFLQTPKEVGTTKIVQLSSRNHYLGEIVFDLRETGSRDGNFIMHEVKVDWEKKLSPNPLAPILEEHKSKLQKIQEQEQKNVGQHVNVPVESTPNTYKTAYDCISCHKAAGEKWQSTPHSIAYATLLNSKSEFNSACIGCHTLGYGSPEGFKDAQSVYQLKDPSKQKKYQKEVMEAFKNVKSVRDLTDKRRLELAQKWNKLDADYEVQKNFANVQCLNCHTQSADHPFSSGEMAAGIASTKPKEKFKALQSKCLTCHTTDQSAGWYDKQGKLDEKVFLKHYQKIQCNRK